MIYNDVWKNVVYAGFKSVALIPTLTSNTGAGVTVSASSYYGSGFEAWRAFNSSGSWATIETTSFPQWLQIKFDTSKIISKFDICFDSACISCLFKLQGSNGSSYVDLTEQITQEGNNVLKSYDLTDITSYTYYRIYIISQSTSSGTKGRIYQCQLYGNNA